MTYLRAALVVACGGCGLISSDVTNFDLTLPPKTFTVDTASWMVDNTQAQAFLSTSCAQNPDLCMSAAQTACAKDCTGACDTSTKTCDLGLDVSLYNKVDLVMEKPELQTINSEPVIHVTIDSVTYDVTVNSLDVDTPPLTVFVAPVSVMDPKDPMAQAVGTVDPIPAGMTLANQQLKFTDTGKDTLINTMSTYKTPFNIIVGATLEVKSGDPVPQGMLTAVVNVKAHAGI
jgi:hypothetical protein